MTDDATNLDRRALYRLEPPPVLEPILSIIQDGHRVMASAVIDVTLTGMRVEFDDTEIVHFTPPQDVIVSLQAPGLDGFADIGARIVFAAYTPDRCIVGLEFIDKPELSERATSTFFSIFNRRGKIREAVTLGEGEISAYLLDSAHDPNVAATLEVRVVNYSPTGIGFLAREQADTVLRNRVSASLALKLLETDEYTTVSIQICHRVAQTDAAYYGCLFEAVPG